MEAVGLAGSIIAIIGAVHATYSTINKVTDLPRAFKKVEETLPLAQKLLGDVETSLRNSRFTREQRKSVQDILNACNNDAKEMERIFKSLEKKFKEDQGATSWPASVRGWYRSALRSVKAHRVEDLMKSIFRGLEKLALNRVFQLATTGDLENIQRAIDELSAVPPSLDDLEFFDTFGQIHVPMNVSGNAIAQQINAPGGSHTFNSGRNVFNAPIQSLSFGEESASTQRREILELLSSDYEASKDFNVCRTSGTCMWIFDDPKFQQWRDSESSRILWISLGPGCGKSVLSRALVDERLGRAATAGTMGHFFFKEDDERRTKASQCLCAILHQIFTQTPGANLIRHALPAYEQHGKMLRQNFSVLWQILVECVRSPESGKMVFVVDALDECESSTRHQLLDKLEHLCREEQSSPRANLKILITSRPYDDILSKFEEFPANAVSRIREDEKIADISGDIDLVIDRQVEKIASKLHHRDRQHLSKKLKEMKNRTYLWLHLIFGIIKKRMSAYGKQSSIQLLLKSIPTEISEAYEEILSRNQDEKLTDTVLRIVLAAVQPLTLPEANIALTLADTNWRSIDELEDDMWPSKDFERIIENTTGLFIRVHDSRVFFIHQTAREFLLHPERKGRWQGRLSLPECHSTMSSICISYLLLLKPGTQHLELGPSRSSDPFRFYAGLNWGLHYRAQEVHTAKTWRTKARLLCTQKKGELWASFSRLGTVLVDFNQWNDLAVASHLGLHLVVEYMLTTEGVEDINAPMGFFGHSLHLAFSQGHRDVIRTLRENGAGDVSSRSSFLGSCLQAASYGGHIDLVKQLLREGIDANETGGLYITSLRAASAEGHTKIIEMLLKNGAAVDGRNGEYDKYSRANKVFDILSKLPEFFLVSFESVDVRNRRPDLDIVYRLRSLAYRTPLQLAVSWGHKEAANVLVDNGADVNAPSGFGKLSGTALQIACRTGNIGIVEMLLAKGADPLAVGGHPEESTPLIEALRCNESGQIAQLLLAKIRDFSGTNVEHAYCALIFALLKGHKDIIQPLLKRGLDINMQDPSGEYFLTSAFQTMSEASCMLIIDNGADVSILHSSRDTSLHLALRKGWKRLMRALLEKGVDVDGTGKGHSTPLREACEQGDLESVRLLLEYGADPNICDERHSPALQAAAAKGHLEVVADLLTHDADINAQTACHATALQAASKYGHVNVVRFLLKKGSRVNLDSEQHQAALQSASGAGHREIVELLLDSGANINHTIAGQGTALYYAAANNHEDVVQILLKRGADVNIQGGLCGTALEVAKRNGDESIVQMLRDHRVTEDCGHLSLRPAPTTH